MQENINLGEQKPTSPTPGDVVKHLEMIQGVINRMAGNSFLLKGWSLTVAAALLAFAVDNRDPGFVALAFIPLLGLWALDAYYLRRERLYRELYEDVRQVLV